MSGGSANCPFGGSTSTSAPTGSSASVRLKALSRSLVARPRMPRSFGDVTTLMCRRSPFSSSWPTSGRFTKKYCPGVKSTSSPSRSNVTSSVPFATSCFSLISARTAFLPRRKYGGRSDTDSSDRPGRQGGTNALRQLDQRPSHRILSHRAHRGVRNRRGFRVARIQARAEPRRHGLLAVRRRRARLHDLPPRLDRLPVRAHDRRGARPRRVRARVRRGRVLDRDQAGPEDDAVVTHRFLLPLAALAAIVAAGCGGAGNSGAPVATNQVTMVKSYRFAPETIEIR